MPRCDRLWLNTNLMTFSENGEPYGALTDGAIACSQGKITWLGKTDAIPDDLGAQEVIDLEGRWLSPGLIDCHTHIIYGGNRAREFEWRLSGVSYEQIARQGGGISSTVSMTRDATPETLFLSALKRARLLLRDGVTTLEVKSGYGLNLEQERKMLQVARLLNQQLPITVINTFLGAHTLPQEYLDRREDYVDLLVNRMLPQLADEGLIDAVDGFCETIAFHPTEIRRLFTVAKSLGLPVKLHAEQLSNSGGAVVAAEFQALSADHLEYLDEAGAAAMAQSGMTAVLLPGAYYCLGEKLAPPVELLRKYRIPIAVATDSNPGSSPLLSLLLAANMACQLFGLTPRESLAGVTCHAARALGLGHDRGTLEPGKRADFAIWEIAEPAELVYWVGGDLLRNSVIAGEDYWPGKALGLPLEPDQAD